MYVFCIIPFWNPIQFKWLYALCSWNPSQNQQLWLILYMCSGNDTIYDSFICIRYPNFSIWNYGYNVLYSCFVLKWNYTAYISNKHNIDRYIYDTSYLYRRMYSSPQNYWDRSWRMLGWLTKKIICKLWKSKIVAR